MRMWNRIGWALLIGVTGFHCPIVSAAEPASVAEPLIRLDLSGKTLEGTPLAWTERKVCFLCRDGQLAEFAPTEPKNFSKVTGGFRSYSQAEIRGTLLREFSQGYE